MRKTFIEYKSKNGIRFHHSVTTFDDDYKSDQKAETHYMFEVLLLFSGSIEYSIEGQHFKISPMDIIVVPPNKLHTVKVDPSIPYERMVLHFAPELLPSFSDIDILAPLTDNITYIIPDELVKSSRIKQLFQECKKLCNEKMEYIDLRFVVAILQIVEILNILVKNLKMQKKEISPVKTNRISYACIQYINKNLSKNITIYDLAKELSISTSRLQHAFKDEIGITLHEYIINQKMQAAYNMLMQGTPSQVVAQELGFEYYSTFYNNYMKRFGIAPNSWANIHRKIESDRIDNG